MATFPFVYLESFLYVEKQDIEKAKAFFEAFRSNAVLDYNGELFTSFSIPIGLDDTFIKVGFQDPKEVRVRPREWSLIAFYDSFISKRLILNICKNILLHNNCNFDDTLLLLVELKGEIEKNAEITSDIKSEQQYPNVKYVEWSVYSTSEEDTRRILQDFVRMGVLHKYSDVIREIRRNNWFIQDEDLQIFSECVSTEGKIWLPADSKSKFKSAALHFFDLSRIAISYNLWSYRIEWTYSSAMIVWKNPSRWFHLQIQPISSTGNIQCYCNLDDDTMKPIYKIQLQVSSLTDPVSILFVQQNSQLINKSLRSSGMETILRSLVIICCPSKLNLTELILCFKSLQHLVIGYTDTDVTNLEFPIQLCETMKHLVMVNCGISEIPQAVGSLIRLTVLNISQNNISTLPVCLGNLTDIRTFLYEDCPIKFPPEKVLKRSAEDVIKYLQVFHPNDEPVPYNKAKLIVVGQKGVGKTTLINAMEDWSSEAPEQMPNKTDRVDIKTLQINETHFQVYDLAVDVEYSNTRHLFLSSQCLYLVVIDISQIDVSSQRSVDHLCKLEFWLNMIATEHPKSYVIIVGTHADHPRATAEIFASVRKQMVELIQKYRNDHRGYFENCFVCNTKLLPQELKEVETDTTTRYFAASDCCIPHVLGYFEVSCTTKSPWFFSLTNTNLESLKQAIASSSRIITDTQFGIPKTWLLFYEMVSNKEEMKPTIHFSKIRVVAEEIQVQSNRLETMLRFFHSQGNFLWYENIPEMRDVIVTEPQWLSNQLQTLNSALCDGILHTPLLSQVVWPEMSDEDCRKRLARKLLVLFRSVGLCFSISDDKELFPCNLPVGLPDSRIWPSLPNNHENQTSLLFTFTFLPPTFGSKLIVEVNKKRASFPDNVQPLYHQRHILYVTSDANRCDMPNHDLKQDADQSDSMYHKVLYDIMPYENTLKASIRGPSPCCIVSDVCATIEVVQSKSYQGISFQTHLVCPICEMQKVNTPEKFSMASSDQETMCSKYLHNVGSINKIRRGKYERPQTTDVKKALGDVLDDKYCPKKFVILPINTKSLDFKDRLAKYALKRYECAVHLLCECPGKLHFVDSPGFPISEPKQFLERHGRRLHAVLKEMRTVGYVVASSCPIPLVGPAVATAAKGIDIVVQELERILENLLGKFLHLKLASYQQLGGLETSSEPKRSELAKFLAIKADGKDFGPLYSTYVDKTDEWLWLCETHHQQFHTVQR